MLSRPFRDRYSPQRQRGPRKHESRRNEIPLPWICRTVNTSAGAGNKVAGGSCFRGPPVPGDRSGCGRAAKARATRLQIEILEGMRAIGEREVPLVAELSENRHDARSVRWRPTAGPCPGTGLDATGASRLPFARRSAAYGARTCVPGAMTLVPRSFTLTLPPGNCTLTPPEGGGGSGCRQPTIPKSASQRANTSGVFTPLLSFARDKWQPVEPLSFVSASARKELNDKGWENPKTEPGLEEPPSAHLFPWRRFVASALSPALWWSGRRPGPSAASRRSASRVTFACAMRYTLRRIPPPCR